MANEIKTTYIHPLKAQRLILQSLPKSTDTPERLVLLVLLSYLNLTVEEGTPTSAIVVTGSASLLQLEDSGYKTANLKKKLRGLRALGVVDWKKREDNRGMDFTVYTTPQESVKAKALPDPKRAEQGRKAVAARKTRPVSRAKQVAEWLGGSEAVSDDLGAEIEAAIEKGNYLDDHVGEFCRHPKLVRRVCIECGESADENNHVWSTEPPVSMDGCVWCGRCGGSQEQIGHELCAFDEPVVED